VTKRMGEELSMVKEAGGDLSRVVKMTEGKLSLRDFLGFDFK